MKIKRVLSVVLILFLCLTMLPAVAMQTEAAMISESGFANKIAQLKTVYRDKEYWNGYNTIGYEGTGNKKCYCTYSCAANCSCDCGKFYLNGIKYGGQCFGFANKMAYLVFGSVPDIGTRASHGDWIYYSGNDSGTYYAGDYVRVRSDAHSIFITAVDGDTITYVDCNNYGPCQVKWDRTISKSELKNKTTYVYRLSGNVLTGNGVNNSTNVNMTAGDIVDSALQLLYYNEGSYGSVNKNDNGAVSVGKIQWHGNRALNLLKTIVNMDSSSALSILGSSLYNEIKSSSNWSSRTVSSSEASVLSQLLTTYAGKKAQDDLATIDVTGYINHGKNLGIVDAAALVYFADLENQGGAGMSARVAKSAAANVGSYCAINLNAIHSAALADSVAGYYASRRNQTYTFCNSLSNHSIHNYSGSYHEAAHPHKEYQMCSCGATKYTGSETTVSTCNICNPVGTSSKYNIVLPFRAYLKNAATVYPCSSEHLTEQTGGQIWEEDECIITAVYTNGACKVEYPIGNTYREAYTSLSNFVGNTSASLIGQIADSDIRTYIRANTGTQYGGVDAGDMMYKLGTSGGMTQIFYPTPSGHKLAWVETTELTPQSFDNRFNPYCPIYCYPCATEDFDVYEVDHTTYVGSIWTTDDCTIEAVYADGWCRVTYPAGNSTKTGYTQLSNFVSNVSASHIKYTANARIVVSTKKNLNEELGKIFVGDVFYAVGTSGDLTQVMYPLDAEYGSGYKMGWILTSDLPKITYTVSYNANSGTGAPANQTKTHGVNLLLSTKVPENLGYVFAGWATDSAATEAKYMPGATYTQDGDIVLYAVWVKNKYEITYDANGGINAPVTQMKVQGTDLRLSSEKPSKAYAVTFDPNGGTVDVSNRQISCEFLGWATNSSETVPAYQPGDVYTTNANTTLYAIWNNPVLEHYSIPVREGYVFGGWYTAAEGGTQVDLATIISSNVTVYAHWTVATYGVSYNISSGFGAPEAQIKTHGKNLTLSTTVPTRENYAFLGWATEENPDEVQYHPGDVYTIDNDLMLVAVWKCNLNPVIYVGDAFGKPGDTVVVAVQINENPGIIAARLKISYDSKVLMLKNVEDGGILGEYKFGDDLSANPYVVSWSNGLSEVNYTANGTLVYLTFQIAENAIEGTLPIMLGYDTEEIYNKELENVFVNTEDGVIAVEKADEPDTMIAKWNIELADNFAVNFHLQVNESIEKTAKVRLIIGDKMVTSNVSVLNKEENGYYVLTANLSAAQMSENIIVMVMNGNNIVSTGTYSVRQYCNTILADEGYSQYHALVKKMLNYGAAAQVYFDYDTENLANDGITGVAATDVPKTAEKVTVSDQISNVNFYGASLVYRDRLAVRYYFTGDVTGCTFTANGNTYTPVAKDGMYYVEIADILPQDLDQQITLTVTDADGNALNVAYNPMNYIVRMNEKGSDTLKALVKALYNYHLAAKALRA